MSDHDDIPSMDTWIKITRDEGNMLKGIRYGLSLAKVRHPKAGDLELLALIIADAKTLRQMSLYGSLIKDESKGLTQAQRDIVYRQAEACEGEVKRLEP